MVVTKQKMTRADRFRKRINVIIWRPPWGNETRHRRLERWLQPFPIRSFVYRVSSSAPTQSRTEERLRRFSHNRPDQFQLRSERLARRAGSKSGYQESGPDRDKRS